MQQHRIKDYLPESQQNQDNALIKVKQEHHALCFMHLHT